MKPLQAHHQLIFILLFSLVFFTSTVNATEFYTYEVDGKIVYSDTPPVEAEYATYQPKEAYVVSHEPYETRSRWKNANPTPSSFHPYISTASRKYGVSIRLIHSIIKAESDFNPQAVSRKGAQGLMQIMPQTAQSLGLDNPFDPETNIDAGVRYFKKLLDHFQGNTSLALAAYNAGLSTVEKYQGIPPFPETIEYVRKIKKYYAEFRSS
ncbi:MAG: lytic transglycosylase domain-containing protein [Bdellovibrionales bacterium]|nr:lytic transglycosylase domain-containing protein [Bdellovibrionales bacterium]